MRIDKYSLWGVLSIPVTILLLVFGGYLFGWILFNLFNLLNP